MQKTRAPSQSQTASSDTSAPLTSPPKVALPPNDIKAALETSPRVTMTATSTSINSTEMSSDDVEEWIRGEHRLRHCDGTGRIIKPVSFKYLQSELDNLSLQTRELVSKALTRYCLKAVHGEPRLTRNRLDHELARAPVSDQDAASIFTLAQLECAKHIWRGKDEKEQARTQEAIVSMLVERRPDIHATHIRGFVQR